MLTHTQRLREEREEAIEPFPGVIEILHQLRDKGVQLGLITNARAETQRGKIDRFGLDSLFDCVLIEGASGTGKPDKRVNLHSLEQLQAAPSQAWMVGDSMDIYVHTNIQMLRACYGKRRGCEYV